MNIKSYLLFQLNPFLGCCIEKNKSSNPYIRFELFNLFLNFILHKNVKSFSIKIDQQDDD